MNLSFLGQSSSQLVAESRCQKKENIVSNAGREDDTLKSHSSFADAFKDSIRIKEQERNIKKLQRQMRNKDDVMTEMSHKCERLDTELKKARKLNKQLRDQNRAIKQQLGSSKEKQQQNENILRQQVKKLKEQLKIKELRHQQLIDNHLAEIAKLNNTIDSQQKQKKISIKRLTLQNQQLQRELEGKISVKEKQLAKIEEAFESRKKQHSTLLNEQQREIDELCYKVGQLQEQIRALTEERNNFQEKASIFEAKSNELEAVYKEDMIQLSAEVDKLKKSYEYEQWFNKQTNQRVLGAVKTLQLQFELKECDSVDPFELLEKYREQIGYKMEKTKKIEEVAKLKGEIDNYRVTQVQLRNKLNIVQEELDFTKKNSNKSDNLASIIKQHLHKHDIVYTEQKTVFKENINKNRSKSVSKVVQNKENVTPSKHQHSLSYRINKKLAQKSGQKEGKDGYDLVRDELTSKKKSLVYIMFGANQQPQHSVSNTFVKSAQKANVADRRRSCSMGELVRRRCEKKVHQE